MFTGAGVSITPMADMLSHLAVVGPVRPDLCQADSLKSLPPQSLPEASRLLPEVAARHREHSPGDVGGLVGGQEA